MEKMPTIYLYEKGIDIGKAVARFDLIGEVRTDDAMVSEIRLWAQSIVDEIDKWREDEIPSVVVLQTSGVDRTVLGEPLAWEFKPVDDGELGEGLWLIRVLAMTREHAMSVAADWSTRTDRGADDEILSAEELPLGQAGTPNWLVVIGKPAPEVIETVRTSRGERVHGKRDAERALCGVRWADELSRPDSAINCSPCLRYLGREAS